MSYVSAMVSGDGISVVYSPARSMEVDSNRTVPASVHVELESKHGHLLYLSLSIADARTLLAELPGVLAQHEAAVSGAVVDLAKKTAA
ncbi:hypothetical protein [Nocardia cyriacigeorgica]|jgi:hypothetical protein|uniref:hypothetical protein n=1 Tax=Nocardia cyriacigeorgica TaxID=135487 RepID=UPI000CEA6823|nr:hypothetical protein [Nocardia cyriacigeorgica]AVH21224.1 hypothetical protein C5B73_06815 [Nocardia cyriacigeorgica]MBF6499677.1 hypothetical protein [Nocardia cyriacigeorgica]PPJ07647.1 hypothetical protein C5E43_18440 [Nocardia cyriacigeorgica]